MPNGDPPFGLPSGVEQTRDVVYGQGGDRELRGDLFVPSGDDRGVRAEIFVAEGAEHGFFNRSPWYEPTLKRMAEFLVGQLGIATTSP